MEGGEGARMTKVVEGLVGEFRLDGGDGETKGGWVEERCGGGEEGGGGEEKEEKSCGGCGFHHLFPVAESE